MKKSLLEGKELINSLFLLAIARRQGHFGIALLLLLSLLFCLFIYFAAPKLLTQRSRKALTMFGATGFYLWNRGSTMSYGW